MSDGTMNRIAARLIAGAIVAITAAPVVGHAQSRVYIAPKETKSQLGYRDISGLNWREVAKHYAPARGISDWRKAIPARHWKEGYSAYQIAHAWQNANPKLPPAVAALFYGPVELLAAIPEHKTPLPGGRAPSQSDLLVFVRIQNRVCAMTVEGKKNEGFGQTVGEWSTNASSGKIKRLKHIAAKLGLAYPPAGELRYQLLHRTASAVIEAGRFNADCAATIVHSFSPSHESFTDFARFLNAFGIRSAKRDKIYKTTKPGLDLYFGWASPAGAVAVVETPAPAKPEPQPKPAPAPAKPKPQPAPAVQPVTVAQVAAPPPKPAAPAKVEAQPAQAAATTAPTKTVAPAKLEAQQPQPAIIAPAPAEQEAQPAATAAPKVEAPSPEPVAPATPKPKPQPLVRSTQSVAPQPKPQPPAPAKPQIERAAETTVVADVATPEIVTPAQPPTQATPEKVTVVVEQEAPTPSPPAQTATIDAPAPSWFGANWIWVLLLAALVTVGALWTLKKRADATRQIHHKLDRIMEKDGVAASASGDAKLTKAERDSIQKGREFEDFIVEMFHKDGDYFSLMSRSADKFTGAGVSAKDATDPDLKYNFLSRGRTYPFAVECKWRKKFQQDKELTVTSSAGQLQRYKSYERHTKEKTFIVLGVGGSAGNPEHLFVIPVSDIQDPTLTKKELLPFYQRSKSHFTYDPENKVLKMVSD